MKSRYIDAEKLKEYLSEKRKEFLEKSKKDCPLQYQHMADGLDIAEQFVNYLQEDEDSDMAELVKELEAIYDYTEELFRRLDSIKKTD